MSGGVGGASVLTGGVVEEVGLGGGASAQNQPMFACGCKTGVICCLLFVFVWVEVERRAKWGGERRFVRREISRAKPDTRAEPGFAGSPVRPGRITKED